VPGAQRFAVCRQEWWHFDYEDWQSCAVQNVTFEKLEH
jgi:D-alanyl-D-alanine dipeptidase